MCGGLDRGNEFDELIPYMENVRVMVVFGETQDKFAKLGNSQGKYVIKATDVEDAVDKIQDIVEPNDVVLLSPACASWDQYHTFEERVRSLSIDSERTCHHTKECECSWKRIKINLIRRICRIKTIMQLI